MNTIVVFIFVCAFNFLNLFLRKDIFYFKSTLVPFFVMNDLQSHRLSRICFACFEHENLNNAIQYSFSKKKFARYVVQFQRNR